MTPKTTIAEALEALNALQASLPEWRDVEDPDSSECLAAEKRNIATIRSALTDAAAELRTLDAIFDLANHLEITPPGGHVTTWTVMLEIGSDQRLFDADTRQLALQAACDWIKKEGEK